MFQAPEAWKGALRALPRPRFLDLACWLAAGGAVVVARLVSGPAVLATLALAAVAAVAPLLRLARERSELERALGQARSDARDARERLSETQGALLSVAGELESHLTQQAESERHFALALQGSNDGVWEYDLRSKRLYLSPDFRERLGLEPGEFAGRLAWFEDRVHPDDVARWRLAVQAHLEQRASYNMDVRLRTPSGEYRWFRARGSAEWDLAGQPVRMSGSLTDVTERRFAEAQLRQSEESFRSLSAASPVGILRTDAAGQGEWCNQRFEELSGLSDFEAVGEGWLDPVDPGDRDAVLERWRAYVADSAAQDFHETFRVMAPDGTQRWLRSRANAVRDGAQGVAGFVVTFEDVTGERLATVALADARDKAMQAAQAKSEFLANMSHEIRTPLNGIVGMAELMTSTELSDEQRDYVRTINTSADALLAIINDILDFSKIEAGKMTIETVEFDLRASLEDVAELLAPRAREHGLELVVAVDPAVPRCVTGDPVRVRQILINLASNAIKFTDHGEVELGAEMVLTAGAEAAVRLHVRDTGIGIPPERLGAVFESFTQADGSTTRKYGGTGLGLTICRQLAKLMGGTIHVRSEVGTGSVFWVELPLPAAAGAGLPEHACDLGGARILVVDDRALNRRILGDTLRGWGAHPQAAESGEEAVALVAAAPDAFDLVLMDLLMPGMGGHEAARRLHALPGAAKRLLVMVSSSTVIPEAAGDVGPGLPIEAWLTRPVRESSLARMLARVLGRAAAPVPAVAPLAATDEFADLAVLLVDDNEVNRKVATRMLQKLGVTPSVAVNGCEAVRSIAERDFALVLMDCQMPEMDGFEATRAVRAREAARGGHVFIVAMTANAMEGDRERCLACGMDDYVAKPVKLDALAGLLRAARERLLDRAA